MDYLQTLLDLDAAALARLDSPALAGTLCPAIDPAPLTAADTAMLHAVQAEIEGVATLIAVSASIANALTTPGAPPVNVAGFATYAPGAPAMGSGLRSLLVSLPDGAPFPGLIDDLGRRLSLAGRMARAFASERPGQKAPGSVDPETLADAWNRTCICAAVAVRALPLACTSKVGQSMRAAEDVARLTGLAELLDRVAEGEPVCIEPDGCVIVPGWAERRRHPRVRVDQRAEIVLGAHVYQARLLDASIGGLGIEGPRLLLQGDAVAVRLEDGRKLRAHVAWVNGSLAGLRFLAPLEASDPLLVAGLAQGQPAAAA